MIPIIPTSVPAVGNVFCPEWMAGECNTDTPQGYEDLAHTYAFPSIPTVAAPGFAQLTNSSPGNLLVNQILGLDADSEFWLREFSFARQPGNTDLLGDVAIRFRDGKGRTLMDDFVVIDDIFGPLFPCLIYQPGDQLLIDLQNRGTTTPVGIQLLFKGFKRRRKIA